MKHSTPQNTNLSLPYEKEGKTSHLQSLRRRLLTLLGVVLLITLLITGVGVYYFVFWTEALAISRSALLLFGGGMSLFGVLVIVVTARLLEQLIFQPMIQSLCEVHQKLELQVQERTAALAQANQTLQAEITKNTGLYAETLRRLFKQTLLYECTHDLVASHDISAAIAIVTERMVRHLDATAMCYYTYDEASGTVRTDYEYWTPQASYAERRSVLGEVWLLTDYPHLAIALRTSTPQILHRSDPNLTPTERDMLVQWDGQTVIAVPMVAHKHILGYFEIWDSRAERDYDEVDVRLLLALATQTALAIQHTRLLETLEQRIVERTQALKENEERTRLIIDTALDAVITMDQQGIIIGWTPQAETTFGWSGQEVMGRALATTIIPPQYQEAHRRGLRHFLTTGEGPMLNKRIEITALHRDGYEFPVELSIVPVWSGGQYIFSAFIRDITERKQAEAALALARDQALVASRLKTELLAKVSHELRTPLGAILGFAELLDGGIYGLLSDEQRQATAKIIANTQDLTGLVNELLGQAQIEAGKLKLNVNSFNPTDILDDTISKLSVLARTKGLSLSGDIAASVPATLVGDQARLQQILVNLVNNALKFTMTGGVQVRLYCPDDDHWALQVSDTGPGIPAEAQAYIFEPFRQVDGSATRVHAGTGLGLSIVKQLTSLMGGEITLESEAGRGSTFTVSLPFQEIRD